MSFENSFFYLSINHLQSAEKIFLEWYRQQALQKISERVRFYYAITNLKYHKIKISNAKKRWGSCSSQGNLNFSWRLIMAPLEVIDYVVVHELVHLEEKNHANRFWNKVEKILPDYKIQKKWLKENGHNLKLN